MFAVGEYFLAILSNFHFSQNPICLFDLKPHATFLNPAIIPYWTKVTGEEIIVDT
jgi:hypothetical protein